MLYPKNKVNDLIINTINSDVIAGRHWIIYNNDKIIDKSVQEIKELVIKNNGNIDDILKVKSLSNNKRLIVFNGQIIEDIFNEIVEKIYITYPKFPRLHSSISIAKLKDKECDRLTEYINNTNASVFDIFLYKGTGLRSTMLILHHNKEKYMKPVFGFYLTEEDLDKVNEKLQQYGKQIVGIMENECLCKDYGIRYTLNVKNVG